MYSLHPLMAERVIYPLGDLAFGSSVIKYYHWLQKTQWFSAEQLQELQDQKLRKLIEHIYNNVPYYRQLFNEHGLKPNDILTAKEINKLPILTKGNIRTNFEKIKVPDFKRYHPILNATGGSTGEPLQYYITKDLASISWAGIFRGWSWAGYKIGDKRISFGGSSLVPNKKPTAFMRTRQLLERNMPLSAVSMNKEKYDRYIDKIRKYRPKYLKGYPSSIYLLADYCKENNINDICFKAVFSTAEVLLPHYRQSIQEQFNCEVFDEYGSYDGGGQALECELHNGYHISAEKVIIEIVDESGHQVPPGKPGRIIVTDLYNYAMPFVRYEVGDIGVMADKKCECGRGLPLLKTIEGRTTDIIKLSNGIAIAGPAVTLIFKNCDVKQYQLAQISSDSLLIRVIKGLKYTEQDTSYFMGILKEHVGEEIKINLEFCDDIPLSTNSKYRFIISNT